MTRRRSRRGRPPRSTETPACTSPSWSRQHQSRDQPRAPGDRHARPRRRADPPGRRCFQTRGGLRASGLRRVEVHRDAVRVRPGSSSGDAAPFPRVTCDLREDSRGKLRSVSPLLCRTEVALSFFLPRGLLKAPSDTPPVALNSSDFVHCVLFIGKCRVCIYG